MLAFGPTESEIAAAHSQKVELVSSMLRTGGAVKIKALGTSMLPTIWPGDILVIESISHDQLVCGELLAVRVQNEIRVHRLLEKTAPDWITRGDSMPQNDPAISPNDVLGRVSEIRR